MAAILLSLASSDVHCAAQSTPVAGTSLFRSTLASDVTINLAENKLALLPIVISPAADADTKAVAETLRDYLSRLSGATFIIETGDGSRGIVLGTLAQFPDAALNASLEIRGVDGREGQYRARLV